MALACACPGLALAAAPDVIVSSLFYNSNSHIFTSVVKNLGTAATPVGGTIGVEYSVDGLSKTWGAYNGTLAAGASVIISASGNGGPYTIPNGTHSYAALADDVDRFLESNEGNNALLKVATFGPAGADVVVTSLTYDSTTHHFSSMVKNQGKAATPAGVTIGVGYLVDGVSMTWGAYNGTLAAGASVTISSSGNGGPYTIPNGTHTISALADDVNRFSESNETNNSLAGTRSIGTGLAYNINLGWLTGHNTSAYAAYNQSNFPAPQINFGTTSGISSTQTVTINPAEMDRSMNPVTPGHVSGLDVHTLIPSRPDLRWFAHLMPWWGTGSPFNMGMDCDTPGYVQDLVTDLLNRGFNGVIIVWDGTTSRADSIAQNIQDYLHDNGIPASEFTFTILIDQGLIYGKPGQQALLQSAVQYLQTNYFNDANYEKEGGLPILMFYGVRSTISGGAATMAAVKSATGGNMVWVTETATHIAETWADQTFDWHNAWYDGLHPTDPYNLLWLNDFLTKIENFPSKKAYGAMCGAYNDTLSGRPNIGHLPSGSGACIVQRAAEIDANIPPNITRMQWVTWNDYMEGSSVEPGVENKASVKVWRQGTTLHWSTASGTGDETTIGQYDIYASRGADFALLGSASAGAHSFTLAANSELFNGSPTQFFVNAVGKPCIRDHGRALWINNP